MADANIRAVITAEDRGSAVVSNFGDKVNKSFASLAVVTAAAAVALDRFTNFLGGTLDAANKNQAALTGLSSVAKAFGQNADLAGKAAQSLAKDGLMTVTDAAVGLKNLLASGFSLDQAVTLMKRFKDSAAFGRQSALSFGQAVASATEGIKNGNSILVDNAGVTKNLSVILTEAGFSAQDLMRATTDSNVRMALFNGILKETTPQLGDAARLTGLFAGKQAMVEAQTTILNQRIGAALQPILLRLLEVITPIIEKISNWIEQNPKLAAGIAIGITALLVMVAVLGVIATIVAAVTTVVAAFGAGVVAVAVGIGAALAVMVGYFITHFNAAKGIISNFKDFVVNVFKGLANVIIAPFRSAFNLFADGLNAVASKIPGMKLRVPTIPAFANGVQNFGGGVALVGERGPELVNLPGGSSVIPNNKIGGGTVNLSVNVGTFVGTEMEKRKLAEELFRAYEDLRSARGLAA